MAFLSHEYKYTVITYKTVTSFTSFISNIVFPKESPELKQNKTKQKH